MGVFPKYAELVTLDRRPEILSVKQVVATEKIHGTNFRVFFPAGMTSIDDVRFGGRNEEFEPGDNGFYGGRPVLWFKSQPDLLHRMREVFTSYGFSDVTVYGEAFGAGIQKGVKYTVDDTVHFRAFDIRVGECFVSYDLFVSLCDSMGLVRVPEIWRGEPSLANFDALIEKPSVVGAEQGIADSDNTSEGVVIRSNPLLRDVFGQWLIIKHKSAHFAEKAKARAPRPERPESDDAVTVFVETYVVPGRVRNAVGRLRDANVKIHRMMDDMPTLVPALVADLHKECEPEWQALVAAGHPDKFIRAAVTRTLAAVWRRMLLEGIE